MKQKIYILLSTLLLAAILLPGRAKAQYPGGVSTGTTRGYKVDYYNGDFANVSTAFGAGTSNASPGNTGYTSVVTGTEFHYLDVTYNGLEYTGILEIPVTGNYTFVLDQIDDEAALYIDGVLKVSGVFNGSAGSGSATINLTAGDHAIKVKQRNGANYGAVRLRFTAVPAGSGITVPVDVNANWVRYDGAQLTAWYKASNVNIVSGNRVSRFINQSPFYWSSAGNLAYQYSGDVWATSDNGTQVNFNPGVNFDGDDVFTAVIYQTGLSFRGASKSMFMVSQPTSAAAVSESGNWIFYHDNSTNTANKTIGFYRGNTSTQLAIQGGGNAVSAPYMLNEPKLLSGYVGLPAGANKTLSSLLMTANGSTGTPTDLLSDVVAGGGLTVKNMATSRFPEAIYYPFELSAAQRRRVNTYLGVKYGITLQHDYENAAGTTIFSLANNAGYTSRIFGIGNETAQALNQKQSQSQMTGTANGGYDFLVLSKGATITTTNAANTGSLSSGSFLLMGDNSGAMAKQTNDMPTYSSTCAVERLGREWKAQVTGTPGTVTIRAGSSTSGSFLFPGYASGLKLVVDGDQDGDFTTGAGQQRMYDPASFANGVATFNNVAINNGEVFTFVWTVTSPGGVSTGLALWLRGDAGTSTTTHGTATTTWNDQSSNVYTLNSTGSSIYRNDTAGNFNPYISFSGTNYFTAPSGFANFTGGASSFFVANLANTTQNYVRFFDFGTGQASNNIYFGKYSTTASLMTGGYNGGTGGASYAGTSPVIAGNNRIYSFVMPGGTAGTAAAPVMSADGTVQAAGGAGAVIPANITRTSNFIGKSNWSADAWLIGNMSEGILYNTALSAADQLRVNSYLAVKYGRTLPASFTNYIASDNTTVLWNNTTYWNNVFGIGRDDCSGLLQKQSKSTTGTDNVAIGLGTIAATNAANTSTLASNLQFILVGNDGAALSPVTTNVPAAYSSISCNANRYARTWKVTNTGSVTNTLQLQVGNTGNTVRSNWTNVQLAVNTAGDNTFASATTLYPAVSVSGGVATFNNVSLPDGAVFTVCFTIGYPGGVSKPSTGITITAPVSGTTQGNINGLSFKYYTLGTAIGGGQSVAAGYGAYNPTLRSSGYYHNATNFHNILGGSGGAASTNTGLELSGKFFVATPSATYQFQGNVDDRFAVIIDGVTVLDVLTLGLNTSGNVNLTSGYHDIIIRGGNITGANVYDLTWNNGSGSTFVPIPDANLYTSVQNPSAWYASDNNLITLADGTSMTGVNWPDLSGNNNPVTGAAGPVYYSTNTAYIRNYNPSINFSSSYFYSNGMNGLAYGTLGKSIIAMGANQQSGGERMYTAYGKDATATNFGLTRLTGANTGKLSLFTGSNNFNEPTGFYTGQTTATFDIIGATLTNPNGASLYANGALRGTGALGSNYNTVMNDNDQFEIGGGPDYAAATYSYAGVLNEVLHYPWSLSAAEQQRINSYLAIKWGITLNQSTATNYLASDGSTIWNASLNTAFNRDITGIGRDDCGALYQLQSTSTDSADIVSLGLGSIAATNAANTNTFGADKTFLVFARNSGDLNSNTTNMPTSLTGCYVKLNREWQVQTTGTPGAVSIQMGKTGLMSINASNYRPVLLISNTAGDYTLATMKMYDSVSRGKAYFSNITFTNGQYFTLAYINAAPGGVTSNMKVWFNADYDAFSDAAQTTYAQNDGDPVASINNMKFGANITAVSQVNASYNPIYKPGAFNYNTGILFDGSNDVLATPASPLVNTTDYRSATAMTSVFAGKNQGTGNVFWFHDNTNDGSGTKTALERNQAYWSSNTSLGRTPTVTTAELYTFANSTSGSYRLLSNLKSVGSGTATNTTTVNGRFRIGSNHLGGAGNPANFYLGEFVTYSDDKGATTTTEMRQIHSYLATKYGFTLDAAAVGNAYIASNGTTQTYNYTNYWNRITGIGRDDCSGFEQKQSFSQEATGALVRISNDATNGLAATNKANTAAFANNFSFLLFGDNGKDLTWTGVDKVPGNLVRLNRVWRVKETGTVSTVYLQVPASSSAETVKLPASDDANVYLLVSSTGNFKAPDVSILMADDGSNNLYASYDFADGDYYTFASKKSCIAPAGISDGLVTWYRTDDMAVGTIPASTSNAVLDRAGSQHLSTSATAGYTVGAASGDGSNFQRILRIDPGASLLKTGVTETALSAADQGTLYIGKWNNETNYAFGATRPSGNYRGLAITDANARFGSASASLAVGTPGGVNNFYYVVKDPANIMAGINGTDGASVANTATLTAASDYELRVGSRRNASTGVLEWNSNSTYFAEAFSYNRALTATERSVLNTYMALKYGQTMAANYYSPEYNGANAATTTIYDVSTYGNRVFGVGIDSVGCFSQNQSDSVVTGSMLKMSVDGVIVTDYQSRDMSKFAGDRTYVAAGDDNGSIASWTTGVEVPAWYTSGSSCVVPQRITREWKVKALNNDQSVRISIPDNSHITASGKLPVLPAGATKVYMIVNGNPDFTVNADQEERVMTYKASSREWEVDYQFPASASSYKYITFVTKPDATALTPIAIAGGTADGSLNMCDSLPYIYYKGLLPANTSKALVAVNPNSNTWSPSAITIDNQGSLTGGGGTFTNSGTGYYQSTDGLNTIRITKRLHTIQAAGTYSVNGGVIVRLYYDPADLTNLQGDVMPGGAPIAAQGWFKAETNSAAATVGNMTPGLLANARQITPVTTGIEKGVNYVEFLVTSFSTFGYYAKTTPFVLPVMLTSFTASVKDCKTQLNWKTAEESGFDRFEIERSTNNGTSYSTIGTVASVGFNSSYSYPDNTAVQGKNLYRLKMIDTDGKYKYSSVNLVTLSCDGKASIVVYPNPASEIVKVSISGYTSKVTGKLYNSIGQLEKTTVLVNGTNDIQTNTLSNGLYNLVITDETGKTSTYKVMVKH